jgi:hypothetical protein
MLLHFSIFLNRISFGFKFIPIPSNGRQMELFQQYTNDDLSGYAQSAINWQSIFQYLQDYRKKAIEQSNKKKPSICLGS